MADKITFEQLVAAAREAPGGDREHLALSLLFDLSRRTLSEQEAGQAWDHLAICPDCREDLTLLLGPEASARSVARPLMAVGSDTLARRPTPQRQKTITIPWPRAAAAPTPQWRTVTEDDRHMVQCIIVHQGDRTLLTLQIKEAFRTAFEGQSVQVVDTNEQEICSGHIIGGILFRIVPGLVKGPLTLWLDEEAPAEPPDAC